MFTVFLIPQAETEKYLQTLQMSSEGRMTNCPSLSGTEGVLRHKALKFETGNVLGKGKLSTLLGR